jgi:hypothetical protein
VSSPTYAQLILMPEVQARRALESAGSQLRLVIARPVFAALGRGQLRVLRIRPVKEETDLEVVAGYDSYERIEP